MYVTALGPEPSLCCVLGSQSCSFAPPPLQTQRAVWSSPPLLVQLWEWKARSPVLENKPQGTSSTAPSCSVPSPGTGLLSIQEHLEAEDSLCAFCFLSYHIRRIPGCERLLLGYGLVGGLLSACTAPGCIPSTAKTLKNKRSAA